METPSVARPSPGAVRAKRLRERRKSGKVYVRFEATSAGINRLVEQGWLDPEKRGDWQAVTTAFLELGASALWPENRRNA